ncbi:hypothetical protein LJY25_02950 [Hymenobacter sp. BT175]|uniref:hypothetical protein n=1 Tax=Hymenobacter translucens TaxID=2886507 RepID=UPI001D0F15B7|nr:hypothetical protein [Hymenobacter translucens]MCC2545389.1 hypothetical protein [Hymenobacter translucens]
MSKQKAERDDERAQNQKPAAGTKASSAKGKSGAGAAAQKSVGKEKVEDLPARITDTVATTVGSLAENGTRAVLGVVEGAVEKAAKKVTRKVNSLVDEGSKAATGAKKAAPKKEAPKTKAKAAPKAAKAPAAKAPAGKSAAAGSKAKAGGKGEGAK